uniref:Uncharacterized protein n=1 Tax=Physcomitrium patens TaxID=3218 RepID=A0A2K1KMD2_PHYPA|nr:hypothetical protein PHYPA_005831 [Physcomitrium patens]
MAIKDKFIEIVFEIEELGVTWQALKNIFEANNSFQILLLSIHLYNMCMLEGCLIKEYL